jgi:MFS family permease
VNTTDKETYKWYVLALAALTHTFCAAIPVMCLPVLFKDISEDLGLSLVQIGLVWGFVGLPGVATGLLGGDIGDRFGPRRTLSVICVLAGMVGALRGLSNSFFTLSMTILVFSTIMPIIPMNVHKTCGVWFSKRQLGLANGVVSMGMALGFMAGTMFSATILSPWLGGWRNVLFFYGAISILIGLLWRATRPAPRDVTGRTDQVAKRSFRENLSHVGKLRDVWLLGLYLLGVQGCIQGALGYLPLYLRGLGWVEAAADSAAGSFHLASMVFVIPLAFANDVFKWTAIILAGIVRDGSMAIFMTLLIETDGVGVAYASTASGLVLSLSALGKLIAPPLGNGLAELISPGSPFVFWAALAAGGWLGLYFVRESASGLMTLKTDSAS